MQQGEWKMAFRLLNWMIWTFCLGTLALILIAVTSCTEEKERTVTADIESPLRNTCQSGDLDPTFPKCRLENLTSASVVMR